jgi:arsenate reductase
VAKTITIYGIKNCDTMKKARAWLDGHGVAYGFHDYKTAGIERGRLEGWAAKVGWESLLNRAGTTFRKLPEKDKEGLTEKKAIALMVAQPSMIKRPVLDVGGKFLVGFKPEQYAKTFGYKIDNYFNALKHFLDSLPQIIDPGVIKAFSGYE